jgi:hypothetical protein
VVTFPWRPLALVITGTNITWKGSTARTSSASGVPDAGNPLSDSSPSAMAFPGSTVAVIERFDWISDLSRMTFHELLSVASSGASGVVRPGAGIVSSAIASPFA